MCLGLKSISIPKTVSTIGRCALSYVKNVYAEHFTEDMLTAIILPPAVRSKQLLKNAKKSIVKRLFENGDEKQLIRFFSFGFFASKSLDNFIKLASEKEMVVLVSYLLEEQKKKSPKKSTKFNI